MKSLHILLFIMVGCVAPVLYAYDRPATKEGVQEEIKETNISDAIGILNTARGGLFAVGEPGSTNNFTQFKDSETIALWNRRMKETEEALTGLLSSKTVKDSTKNLLLQKMHDLKYMNNNLISLCNTVFKKNVQQLMPPTMKKSSDKETPLGQGKIKEIDLRKINFTGTPWSVDAIIGENLDKLFADIVSMNNTFARMRREKTNSANTKKALDLLAGLGSLTQASIIITMTDYIDLLLTRLFVIDGLSYVEADPVLGALWLARIAQLGESSKKLDPKYALIVDSLVKEHKNIVDTIRQKAAADKNPKESKGNREKIATQLLAAPMLTQQVIDSATKRLPLPAEQQKLSDASRDAILLIKKLQSTLRTIAAQIG